MNHHLRRAVIVLTVAGGLTSCSGGGQPSDRAAFCQSYDEYLNSLDDVGSTAASMTEGLDRAHRALGDMAVSGPSDLGDEFEATRRYQALPPADQLATAERRRNQRAMDTIEEAAEDLCP